MTEFLLWIAVVSLPLMDLEAFKIFGKSIVLPYVTILLLVVPLIRTRAALGIRDVRFQLLVLWLFCAVAGSVLNFLDMQRADILRKNVTQIANLVLMIAQYALLVAALRQLDANGMARVATVFIVTAAAGAVLSAYQVASTLYGLPYIDVFRSSNLYFKPDTLTAHGGGSWIGFPRAYGAAPEPTFWAGYLLVGFALALGRVARVARSFDIACLVLIGIGCTLTFSRAALLPLAIVIAAWGGSLRSQTVPVWVMVAAIAIALVFSTIGVLAGDQLVWIWRDMSAVQRLASQSAAAELIAAHPVLGVGPGALTFLLYPYATVPVGASAAAYTTVYSYLLSVFVSTGLVGGAIFLAFLLWLIVGMRATVMDPRAQPHVRHLPLCAGLAAIAVVAYWAASPAYNMSFLWFPFALCAAVSRGLSGSERF